MLPPAYAITQKRSREVAAHPVQFSCPTTHHLQRKTFFAMRKYWLPLFIISFFVAIYATPTGSADVAVFAWLVFVYSAVMLWQPWAKRNQRA